jgi:high-affinity Fe2+/Pb2+ permease
MELALNLGWFAISVAIFLFFGWYLVRKNGEQNFVIACVALICVVCLLFPVVSMTDDLNSSPAMPEATKFKKIFLSAQVVIHLFSSVLIRPAQERTWASLIFGNEGKPPSQDCLSFDLSRRPPPQFQSL